MQQNTKNSPDSVCIALSCTKTRDLATQVMRMLTFVLLLFLHATFNGGVASGQLLGYYQFEGSFFPSASATCPTPPFLLSPSGSATFVSPGTFDSTKNFNQALSVNTVSGTQSLSITFSCPTPRCPQRVFILRINLLTFFILAQIWACGVSHRRVTRSRVG